MKNKIDPLIEWAVWGHLEDQKDLELILLKGHLLLENVLDTALRRISIEDFKNCSFYRKVSLLENHYSVTSEGAELIFSPLREINKLRNQLAHEIDFEISNGELKSWASDIIDNLQGKKFSRYTSRTKIVHAFSILSKNLLELNPKKN